MSFAMPKFIAQMNGKCEICGDADVDLYCIPDYMNVCKSCLENEMDICDECGQIYVTGSVEFTETDDGQMICEWCMENRECLEDDE